MGGSIVSRAEQVVMRDLDGKSVIVWVPVIRRIVVTVDCGCWVHQSRERRFEILVTEENESNGGAFVRAIERPAVKDRDGVEIDACDGYFRDLDVNGPITAAILRASQL